MNLPGRREIIKWSTTPHPLLLPYSTFMCQQRKDHNKSNERFNFIYACSQNNERWGLIGWYDHFFCVSLKTTNPYNSQFHPEIGCVLPFSPDSPLLFSVAPSPFPFSSFSKDSSLVVTDKVMVYFPCSFHKIE